MTYPFPAELCLDLGAIPGMWSEQDDPVALPRAPGAQGNILQGRQRAQTEGITGDWACAQGVSRNWVARAALAHRHALLVAQHLTVGAWLKLSLWTCNAVTVTHNASVFA